MKSKTVNLPPSHPRNSCHRELLLCMMGDDEAAKIAAFDEVARREANVSAAVELLNGTKTKKTVISGRGKTRTPSKPPKPTKKEMVMEWSRDELLRLQKQWRKHPKLYGSMVHHPWALLAALVARRDLSKAMRKVHHALFYVAVTETYLEFLMEFGELAGKELEEGLESAKDTAIMQTTEGPVGEIGSRYAVGAVARDPAHARWVGDHWTVASNLRPEEFGVWCMRRVWRQEFDQTAIIVGMNDDAVREMSKRIPQ